MVEKCLIIESVIKELKTQTQLKHTLYRSSINFQVNAVSALIAYQFLKNKLLVNLWELQEINDLPILMNP